MPGQVPAGEIRPVSYLSIQNGREVIQNGTINPKIEKILRTGKGLLLLESSGYAQSSDSQSFSFEIDGEQIMKGAPDPDLPRDADSSELMIFDFNGAAENEDMPVYSDEDIAEFGMEFVKQEGNVRVRFTSPTVMNADELNKIQKAGGFAYLRATP